MWGKRELYRTNTVSLGTWEVVPRSVQGGKEEEEFMLGY